MKPIWYFVGLLLLFMGAIITVSGLYALANPPAQHTVLGYLHADIWWGGLMVIAGAIFLASSRKKIVQ